MTDAPGQEPRHVVITGIGPVTSAGTGVEALWEGLRRTESPITHLDRFDASTFRTRIAAQVQDFDPGDYFDATEARRMDRVAQFTLASTSLALDDADLDPSDVDPERAVIQMGSALGGITQAEGQVGVFARKGLRGVDPRLALQVYIGAASCRAAIYTGFTGANATNGMSCASGTIALGDAWRFIRSGEADVALAGGSEVPLAPLTYGAFALIRAMSSRNDAPHLACRPFDAERDGFVMGEGACTLVLVRGALGTAGLRPDQIDLVNSHGSSTPLNDSTESRVIRQVLGDHADRVAVCGTKPYHGHALGASGAMEVGISALVIQRGWIPPILNLEEPGEDCDLDYVTGQGRESAVKNVLSNSFGFGGINACLAISAIPES